MSPEALAELRERAGTWADPASHPHAIAQLDRLTIGKFALDHQQHTARLVETACGEVRGSSTWVGLPAEIEGWERGPLHPLCLAGLTLTIMDWPLRGHEYRIVNECPR